MGRAWWDHARQMEAAPSGRSSATSFPLLVGRRLAVSVDEQRRMRGHIVASASLRKIQSALIRPWNSEHSRFTSGTRGSCLCF